MSVLLQLTFLGALLVLINDLRQHTELWSVAQLDVAFLPEAVNRSSWIIANHPDPVYQTMLIIGGVVSILGLIALTVILVYSHRKKSRPILSTEM